MLAVIGGAQAQPVQVSPARAVEQAGLVDLARQVPDIALDIRYAGGRRTDRSGGDGA